MVINHNMAAMNTYRQLATNTDNTSKSLQKLSSGLRINKAGDDAAGLAISEKMRAQIRGLDQAASNAQNGISLIQTAEGGLSETHSILQRMRELAVQSATDTNTADDRAKIQSEADQLAKEITRISNTTEFNTQNLLAGGLNSTFHIGANAGQSITLSVNAMDALSLGVAGSTVTASGFAAGATGITGVTAAGRGLATGTGYGITTDNTVAALSVAIAKVAGAGDAVAGDATLTDVTDYTGTVSKAFQAVVQTTDGTDVTAIRYSTDGGNTWVIATGAGAFDIGDGLELNLASNAGGYDTDTEFDFTVSPETTTFALYDPDTVTQIGSTVTAYVGSTSIILGDAESNQVITANYTYANLADGANGSFNIVASASTAATTSNGTVTVAADTKAGLLMNTQTTADLAITTIDDAIKTVSTERSKLGGMQNRLDHTIANLGTSSENMTAAESRIRDVDMAKEMMEFTKNNILSQAAQAMLAQANQQPQGVLQLLR